MDPGLDRDLAVTCGELALRRFVIGLTSLDPEKQTSQCASHRKSPQTILKSPQMILDKRPSNHRSRTFAQAAVSVTVRDLDLGGCGDLDGQFSAAN